MIYVATLLSISPFAQPASSSELFDTPAQKKVFMKALEEQDKRYDENEKMLQRPFSSPGYHTTLKGGTVHSTIDSLHYAVALLDSGETSRKDRALDIIRKVISLQDQNPESKTYGIWSWFLEEPLGKMSPPDWNWADFCGTQLLQVAHDHMEVLPDDLKVSLRESIIHAARSIIRRNVDMGYTNIALMGTYVTLLAGELFKDNELSEYGRKRLGRFWEYTKSSGSFSEYNSPNYSIIALQEITRMLQHVDDPGARQIIVELNSFAWLHVARHFHPPTRQWGGPHSRSYSTILGSGQLSFIQRATGSKAKFMTEERAWNSIDACRIRAVCPDELIKFFTSLPVARTETEVFNSRGPSSYCTVGTTYLHPDFTLGSVNIGDLWNQRRPLVAYWNTEKGPAAMRVRCLHDGYDYSSASIFTVQDESTVLAAVNFATDRGDTHIGLDKIKDAAITARDLRLRLDFEGNAEDVAIRKLDSSKNGGTYEITSGKISISFSVPYAVFGKNPVKFEISDEKPGHLDIILYSGASVKIDFRQLQEAAVVFAISMGTGKSTLPGVSISSDNKAGMLNAELTSEICRKMSLSVPCRPIATAEQNSRSNAKLGILNPWKPETQKVQDK